MGEMATIRDVAERANASLGSVSNYLSNKKPVSSKAAARIAAAIEELQFVPNGASRVMRGGRSSAIGFVVTDGPDPFFIEVARGIEDVARDAGLVVVSCTTDGRLDVEEQYVKALAEMRVVGAVVTPAYSVDRPAHLEQLRVSGAGVVVVGGDPDLEYCCSVTIDDVLGGELAMGHLIEQGHKDVVFIGGPGGERQISDRISGAHRAMVAAGHDPTRLRRLDAEGTSIAARAAVGTEIAALEHRPTAIFCASDSLALAALGSLTRAGVRVPEDIAIIGYNDIDQVALSSVTISSIATPKFEMGQRAAQMLLSESETGHLHEHVVFRPRLVVRESTSTALRQAD